MAKRTVRHYLCRPSRPKQWRTITLRSPSASRWRGTWGECRFSLPTVDAVSSKLKWRRHNARVTTRATHGLSSARKEKCMLHRTARVWQSEKTANFRSVSFRWHSTYSGRRGLPVTFNMLGDSYLPTIWRSPYKNASSVCRHSVDILLTFYQLYWYPTDFYILLTDICRKSIYFISTFVNWQLYIESLLNFCRHLSIDKCL